MSFRHEEKLKVTQDKLSALLSWLFENGGTKLYNSRTVSSTYFDNDVMGLHKDSEEGSVPRKKIRVRSYSKDRHSIDNSALEIKVSSIEGRYKTIDHNFDLEKIMNIGYFDHDYGVCKPKVRVTYDRVYYSIHGVRLTIDRNIEYQLVNKNNLSAHRFKELEIAVEIKADNNVPLEYLLSKFPFERIRFSKYSRAINSIFDNYSEKF